MRKRADRFPVNLFCSLMLLSLVPFIYTVVRTRLIVNSPVADGLSIAGHIEWFDLIHETIQAFLIVPLYSLLNQCIREEREFRQRVFQLFLIVNVLYLLFAAGVFLYCDRIVSAMAYERLQEVTEYLRLETVGFVAANVVSFIHVLFVVLGKSRYIYAMVGLKTAFTVIGDLCLIPRFGVNGVAYSNIAVSSVCVVLGVMAALREKLVVVSFRPDRMFLRQYLFTGLFSGAQIFLDNMIYSAIVCKIVNEVAEQGNYWTANNIIWGLLLVPISALAEIIKKDCKEELSAKKMRGYNRIIVGTFLIWLCLIPMLDPFLKRGMGIESFGAIRRILILLMPFYLAYNYTVLFDSILIGHGKTQYCFGISAVVNLIYYPVVYGLLLKGVFTPDIIFICMMFGFGMVVHLGCSLVCFAIYNRSRVQGRRSERAEKH